MEFDVDVCDLIQLEDVTERLKLGPNGTYSGTHKLATERGLDLETIPTFQPKFERFKKDAKLFCCFCGYRCTTWYLLWIPLYNLVSFVDTGTAVQLGIFCGYHCRPTTRAHNTACIPL